MKWNITALLTVLVAIVSYGLYQLSYEVQKLTNDLSQLQVGIEKNKETIQVLKAEWAYENRPDNLQTLAAKHLPLLLVAPYQVSDITDLPPRVSDAFSNASRAVPVPRSSPKYKRRSIAIPKGSLHMATFSKESQGVRGAE